MDFSLKSELTLFPLTIRRDNKHYIVEESLSGDFFEMPKICVDAIHLINNGESLASIEQKLTAAYPNEEVDMVDFVQQLLELGLIKEIDGETVQVKKEGQSPEGFTWISPQVGKIFFNRVTNKLYVSFICINLLFILFNPQLLPHYQDIFLFDAMVFNALTWMMVTLLLVLIHEFGHVLAVRSYGLPAKLEVGHRLFFLVFETDLSLAWKLPPKKRNPLYLAGLYLDHLILFISLGLLFFFLKDGTLLAGVLSIVIFNIIIKTVYQCCFYMKTDIYYLFENVTGCYNLMENGKQYLSKWLPFLKKDRTTETFEGEAAVVRMYGLFYVLGVVLTFGLFVVYFIPQTFYAYSQTLPALLLPASTLAFWDALLFAGQSVLIIGLLLYSCLKSRYNKKASL